MSGFYTGYIHITGAIYSMLVVNLLLVVSNLVLIVTVTMTDLPQTWVVAALAAPFVGPSLVAAFGVFADVTTESRYTPFATFARVYRAQFKPAILVGAIATAIVVILAVDIAAMWRLEGGAVAIPVFATMIALGLLTSLHMLVGVGLGRRELNARAWREAGYLSLRSWYLTALTALALALLTTIVVENPAWGAGVLASPILYLAWANCKHALAPVLGSSSGDQVAVPVYQESI